MSKLHFKYGAMNSGKSDTLIKTAFNYEEQGHQIVTVKPNVDTKGDDMIVARGGHSRRADILATPEMDLRKAILEKRMAEIVLRCVLVDEAQFLSEDNIGQLYQVAKEDEISVIAYGLRADFRGKLFPGSQRLMEIADNIEKLPTMCRCGDQAEFNTRKIDNVYVFEGSQVAIDGEQAVTYDSLCGSCYVKEGGRI